MAAVPIREDVAALIPERRPAVVLDGVTVRRGGRTVLRGISGTIPAGAVTAIVGPSGAGKSTLLGALNGLIGLSSGSITVGGLGRIDHPPTLREHRRRTATVFQEHALIDRLTALDNVLLGLADRRHPLSLLPWPRELRRRAAEALADVGLLHRAAERAGRLSGGERQRIGLARALVRRPTLLLADEPFASVDPALAWQLGRALRDAVSRRGATLVIVLHQIEAARGLSDRIIGLADGRVAFAGPPRDFDGPAQRRLFHVRREEARIPGGCDPRPATRVAPAGSDRGGGGGDAGPELPRHPSTLHLPDPIGEQWILACVTQSRGS